MRSLILQMQTSIDGFVGTSDGDTSWMLWNWGPDWPWDEELRTYYIQTIASADTILLSSNMAEEGYVHHWTEIASRTNDPQSPMGEAVKNARKIVFGKSLAKSVWKNTTLAEGDLVTEVNQVKNQPGKNIIAYGGAGFAASLMKHGLVDELHLIVNPVVIGKGLSMFDQMTKPLNFSLKSATPYACGIVVLQYAKK